jgi:hypothetical protein
MMNDVLWLQVKDFYKKVRNKILHGSQIESSDPEKLHECFDMFAGMYEWVNLWHKLELREGQKARITFRVRSK